MRSDFSLGSRTVLLARFQHQVPLARGPLHRVLETMDGIHELVRRVVQQCASRGVSVPEVLAAFVARTLIGKNTQNGKPLYSLDQPLSQEGLGDIVDRTVERLLEVDSPSLETIKMQAAFDSSYITEESALVNYYERRNTRLKEIQRKIASMRPKDSADFDALTALHRQIQFLLDGQDLILSVPVSITVAMIFTFLLRHASDESRLCRGVEREVAAALESVFPRISLKAFINLDVEEKLAQLDELASIVLGIRVFNQYIGKGGVNILNPEKESIALLHKLGDTLLKELDETQETCAELQQVIVHSHLRHPQGVTTSVLGRWKDELTNRRQYLSYLQSLQEDVAVSNRKVASLRETITSEMNDLKELVGNRASVPKEHVYPKFYEIAAQWTALYHQYRVILGRTKTSEVLQAFCTSYTPSFRGGLELQTASDMTALEEDALAAEAAVGVTSITDPLHAEKLYTGSAGIPAGERIVEENADSNDVALKETLGDTKDSAIFQTDVTRPIKLSIESTPEFMQLPLEYQGFCSWTIVKRQGLLLPGKPELGVIRYKNRFFVFAHQVAICSFMKTPELFVKGALDRAVQSPELIHLLRLQDSFPKTCITRMLQGGGKRDKLRPSIRLNAPERCEASTETPIHFNEKSLASSYHWNEWVFRRGALQLANLRKCVTKSQQTDSSHFRRECNTQVYLPRMKHTQTNKCSGSKPPQHVQYFAGLMGTSKLSTLREPGDGDDGRPALVNFTFEY